MKYVLPLHSSPRFCKRFLDGGAIQRKWLIIIGHWSIHNHMKAHELRNWRVRTCYSQSQLAKVLQVDVMTISRWERGLREIPSFLHLALAYLELKGTEQKVKRKRKTGKEV